MTDFITLDPPASPVPGKGETVLEVTDLNVDFWVDGKFPAAKSMTYVRRPRRSHGHRGRIGLRQEHQLDGVARPAAVQLPRHRLDQAARP